MLSKTSQPRTKAELIRSIQSLYNPKFSVLEIGDKKDLREVQKQSENMLRKSPISVILVQDP